MKKTILNLINFNSVALIITLIKICIIISGSGILVDDAYITLRYAENLFYNSSLTYNVGENVLGVTTPLYLLYTFILVSLFSEFVTYAVLVTGVVFWYLAYVFFEKLLKLVGVSLGPRMTFAIIFLAWPSFWDNQLLGMETPMYVFLFSLCLYLFFLESRVGFSFVAGLLPLVRPEAVVLLPGFLYLLVRTPHGKRFVADGLRFRVAIASLAVPVSWTIFSYSYYGSLIPHSMIAKSGWTSNAYASDLTALEVLKNTVSLTFVPFLDQFNPLVSTVISFAVVCFVTCSLYIAFKSKNSLVMFSAISYISYILFFLFGQGATEASWYSIPSSIYLLLASVPLIAIIEYKFRIYKMLLPLSVALIGASFFLHKERIGLLDFYNQAYGTSARLLNDRISTISADFVANIVIGEIGVYGYNSDHRIIDAAALVSPTVLAHRNGGGSFVSLVKDLEADYIIVENSSVVNNHYPGYSSFFSSHEEREWFLSNYSLIFQVNGKLTFEADRIAGET